MVKRLPSDITPVLLDTVFTAVLRTFYAESQDLAKRKYIWLTVNRNFSTVAKLAKVIFGLEGSQLGM